MNYEELSILLRVKMQQLKMMKDRGYNIDAEKNILLYNPENPDHLKAFEKYYRGTDDVFEEKHLSTKYFKNDSKSKKNKDKIVTYVYYIAKKGEGSEEISFPDLLEPLQRTSTATQDDIKIDATIIISKKGLSSTTNTKLARMDNKIDLWQTFTYTEMLINPIEYYALDEVEDTNEIFLRAFQYRKLNEEELNSLTKEDKIGIQQLPIVKYAGFQSAVNKASSDPIVKYYNFKLGDVLRIMRNNFYNTCFARKSIFYRQVAK